MLYSQMKYWMTRRVHLFTTLRGDGYSICGLALEDACYSMGGKFNYNKNPDTHAYDDLNFCQCCKRAAEKLRTGGKYTPLTKKYPDPRKKGK